MTILVIALCLVLLLMASSGLFWGAIIVALVIFCIYINKEDGGENDKNHT